MVSYTCVRYNVQDYFVQDNDFVWLPGATPLVLMLPGGSIVVTRVPRALPGSCSVAVRQEMDVFESLRKSAFDRLASLEVVFMGSSLCYSE